MRNDFVRLVAVFTTLQLFVMAEEPKIAPTVENRQLIESEKTEGFKFGEIDYLHRFTDKDLYEYTPKGQEDLEKWSDMMSINYYRTVKDSEALALTAKKVLGLYKANLATVVKTKSVPRTKDRPAEHLIVVAFARPDFQEITFARFRMHQGIGTSVIYSHRIYGGNAKDETSVWLKKKSPDAEKTLMKWDEMPAPPAAT